MHYSYRGSCLPIEVLEQDELVAALPGDDTPAGTQTLRAERTKLGLVAGRGTVRGKPVIFTKLRSTYFHEVDSAAGFKDFNEPDKMRDAASFQRAANKIGYAFNWFYSDPEKIAYFNSGANPVRGQARRPRLPGARAALDGVEGLGPRPPHRDLRRRSPSTRRRSTRSTSCPGTTARRSASPGPDENVFSSVYRSLLLEDPLKAKLRGGRKLTLPEVVDIMEVAGTGDLRAHSVLPLALRVDRPPEGREAARRR